MTFLGLALIALTTHDEVTARAMYVAMDALAWTVLVPLAVGSLVTGLVQSLGTVWGLTRHYWVVTKLVITLVATVVLVLYTQTLAGLAKLAAATGQEDQALTSASPLVHVVLALLLLLGATVLSVFKPKGLTARGWRLQQQARSA
ncbi:DUF2269 domain-containing protein [Cellulomonas xylanilytica]|uniref:DUF2269 domain-containing protein n=1 Tax=Cellulomonas xylanilytica TaxID=233583 RepID=UPI001FEB5D86|nr:DUF2269 domain-containing protein [Cellulomonas xylanilytica]